MAYSLLQKRKYCLASALIIAHLVACFLAPWFHQHAGEDHAEIKGDFYHSHVSAVASHAQEFEQDHHDLPDGLHLFEGSQLFEKMQAAIAAHFGQIFTPGKFVPQIDFFVSPFVENSPPNSVVKIVLKLPPTQTARNYFALTATGLSPPLA
ncbi:hypothetical protein L0337_27480 [candidate division KSB1 bacterium]|nr:hypothetical protein [candidate division KSB1 bacterium]